MIEEEEEENHEKLDRHKQAIIRQTHWTSFCPY